MSISVYLYERLRGSGDSVGGGRGSLIRWSKQGGSCGTHRRQGQRKERTRRRRRRKREREEKEKRKNIGNGSRMKDERAERVGDKKEKDKEVVFCPLTFLIHGFRHISQVLFLSK